MRPRTIAFTFVLATVVVLGIAVAPQLASFTAPRIIQPPVWRGPAHLDPGAMVLRMEKTSDTWNVDEPLDQPVGWLDIVQVHNQSGVGQQVEWRQNSWALVLAGVPPPVAQLDGVGRTVSYGLVFETTGDGIADYEVGLSTDAPGPGDVRVWVTELATGETEQQVGPPYGFRVEFRSPWEEHFPPNDPGFPSRSKMMFTFLDEASTPPGLTSHSRFHAWSAIAEGGKVVGWDFAPDGAWLARPPSAQPTP